MPFESFDRRTSTATPDIDLDQAGEIAGKMIAVPYFWAKGSMQRLRELAGAVIDPPYALDRLRQRGDTPFSQMDGAAAGDALSAGPGALLGGFSRAVGGVRAGAELGISGSKLLSRPDAIKLMRELREQGKTYKEVTDALRERFAPIIDEHAPLNQRMVLGRGQRTNDTFELGAMGGQGRQARTGQLTPEMVEQMMREAGYENISTQAAKTGNSVYVSGDPYGNPTRPGSPRPIVRIPADGHIGRSARGKEAGSRFDTGTDPSMPGGAPRRDPVDERLLVNQAGESYADPAALRGALDWRAGNLARPDQAPRGIREPKPETPPRPAEGPDPHPNQLKLLSRGMPIPSDGGWQTTVEREPDAGRFARPVYGSDDAQLLRETRGLRFEIRAAADDAENIAGPIKYQGRLADQRQHITEGQWGTFIDLLKRIDKFGTYELGERESTNVSTPWDNRADPTTAGARPAMAGP